MSDDHHDHDHAHTSTTGYLIVFGALVFLTFFTWFTAVFFDLGHTGNIALALVIACTKASLVLYFFMHLRESPKIVKVTGIAGFFFVGIMLMYLVTDFAARENSAIDIPEGEPWSATDNSLPVDYELIEGPPKAHH